MDFVAKCGQRSQLGNPLHAGANFKEDFFLRTVRWEGLVKQVREGLFSGSPSFLFLAMNPTLSTSVGRKGDAPSTDASGDSDSNDVKQQQKEQPHGIFSELELLEREEEGMKGDGADLGLAFDSKLATDVAKLSPGDKVAFEATLHDLGRR